MSLSDSTIAANRFGFGARPGELDRIAVDPRDWLRRQCTRSPALPAELQSHLSARRIFARNLRFAAADRFFRQQTAHRLLAAVNTETPFVERLVWFWSNHFTVSTQRQNVVPYAEAFEREAVRPHVLGHYTDMLLAAIGHPAMQYYLDNQVSNGPHAVRGGNLNENLAREILELHTLGLHGGYTPRDIRELALMLTGWGVEVSTGPPPPNVTQYKASFLARRATPKDAAAFAFDPERHEPGPKWFMGKMYAGDGVREAERALRAVAAHPSTAGFIANKLARHFIADDPPADAVQRLADTFRRSGGNLRDMALALIEEPAVWRQYGSKIKTPAELVISAARATAFHGRDGGRLFEAMESMGQMPFNANSPAGFPDRGEEWMGGQAVLERVDFCADAAGHETGGLHPGKLARQILGPSARAETLRAIDRAPGRAHAVGLILASLEFQKR